MKRKYKLNEDYFNIIDDEYKAYWLGFIYADGCINNKKNCNLAIKLSVKDFNHLEKFCKCIETNKPVRKYKNNNGFGKGNEYCIITICSKNIVNQLINKGCFENKSLILKFPEFLKEDLIKHFIRGYFDGDGSIFLAKSSGYDIPAITIIGTYEFLSKLYGYLNIDGKEPIYKEKRSISTYSLQLLSSIRVKHFFEFIYSNNIYLDRKIELFNKYLKLT
jgi:hypothetical protein